MRRDTVILVDRSELKGAAPQYTYLRNVIQNASSISVPDLYDKIINFNLTVKELYEFERACPYALFWPKMAIVDYLQS